MYLSLSEVIQITRRRRGLTITALAAKSGVSRNTITKIERGDVMTVRLATITAIVDALECKFRLVEKSE